MRYASYRETYNEVGAMPDQRHQYHFKTLPCPNCKGQEEIAVFGPDLFKYNNGAFIQDAFPYLSAAQRERLMTGYCDSCFSNLVKED